MKPGVFILFIFDVLQFSQTEIRHRQQDKYATKQNYTTILWSSSTTTYLNKKNNNNLQKENYYLTTNVSKNDWMVTMPHVVSSKNGDDYDFRSITSQSSSRSVKKTTTNHFSYVDTTNDDNKIVGNDDDVDDDDDDDVDNDDVIKYYDSNENRTNYDDDDDDFIGVKHETTREYSIATFKKINDEKITGKFVDGSPEEKYIFYNESHLESSTQSHVSTNDGIFHRVKENVAVMKNKNRRSDDNNTTTPSFVGNNNKNFYFAQPLVALAESVDGIVDDDDNNNNNNNIDDDCFENIVENFSITDDIVSENILTDRNEAEKLTNVLAVSF